MCCKIWIIVVKLSSCFAGHITAFQTSHTEPTITGNSNDVIRRSASHGSKNEVSVSVVSPESVGISKKSKQLVWAELYRNYENKTTTSILSNIATPKIKQPLLSPKLKPSSTSMG